MSALVEERERLPFDDGGLARYAGTPETAHLARILELVRSERDADFALLQNDPIPFARLARPLAETRVALVTTAGLHLATDARFRVLELPYGDAGFRLVPQDAPAAKLDLDAPYLDRKFVATDAIKPVIEAACAAAGTKNLVYRLV